MDTDALLRQLVAERRLRRLQLWILMATFVATLLLLSPHGLLNGQAPRPEPRTVAARGDLAADERVQIDLFERASPSVVFITNLAVRTDRFSFNQARIPQGSGSGFLWDAAGHVVTNFHVVEGASQVEVGLDDGSTFAATLVGVAPDKDVAVLRIDAPGRTLTPISVGTSNDLRVGQDVYAIGNPFGLDHTLTAGIVSALGREIEAANRRAIEGVIQTDAAINPGNSGGPLLDSAGRVIGMNTAILSETGQSAGIGFAVPIDTVRRVVEQLIAHGRILRPTIGVELAPEGVGSKIAPEGALILRVVPGSGAERAGLRGTSRRGSRVVPGDVIVGIDGRAVRRVDDLLNALEPHAPGDRVTLTVLRDGREVQVEVVLQAPAG